jgi:GNAT superfamily N-acetyltransferase
MKDLITFRRARPEELDTVLLLLKQAALWLREKKIDYWQEWLAPPPNMVNWIKKGFSQNEFFLVEQDKKVIGCFRLQWQDEMMWGKRQDNAGYVHSFTVSRELAGKGYGYRILKMIEQLCQENGKNLLRLDCGSEIPGIRKYYEGFGFKAVGEVTCYGRYILYEKALDR